MSAADQPLRDTATAQPPSPRGRRVALGRPAVKTFVASPNFLTWLLKYLMKVPVAARLINDFVINLVTSSTRPRPLPFSLWGPRKIEPEAPTSAPSADYVSWTGLVDRAYTGRHLPVCDDSFFAGLPAPESLRPLFRRGRAMTYCPRSSALFCFFAQWFTDSFLRTDPEDYRKNTSNHEIDLCQIYGLNAADAKLLRDVRGGLFKCDGAGLRAFPVRLFDADGGRVATGFENLSYIDARTGTYRHKVLKEFDLPDRRRQLFASGLERGNSTIFYSGLNTLFMREHNRLCREMAVRYPRLRDDDDRLFEYARNTSMVQLLKIIIEDYINHLSSAPFAFQLSLGMAERKPWYRTNRISAEFNLLYRWHSLTPDQVQLGGQTLQSGQFRFNNDLLRQAGVEAVLGEASDQPAGRIGLHNSPTFLLDADIAAIEKSRSWRLRGYNDYRAAFGLPRLGTTLQLTRDPELAALLNAAYGDVDGIELLVGLLAEARAEGAVLGELMQLMVAVDAFSQALTNPLLSRNVFGETAFTGFGAESIASTKSLQDIARRNLDIGNRTLRFGRA